MNNNKNKKKNLLELISILSNNNTIYIINISNLNSNQISILRKNFYEFNIKMKVVKNTLLKKSLEKLEKFNSFYSILNGNSTILFSNSKKINIIPKIIKKFHIKEKIEKPYLKGAYVQESFYFGNKDLNLLINIKSKEDLIINILYSLQYSMKNIILPFLNMEHKIHGILKSLFFKQKNKK